MRFTSFPMLKWKLDNNQSYWYYNCKFFNKLKIKSSRLTRFLLPLYLAFNLHFMSSFYSRRSQKRKEYSQIFFALSGSRRVKAAHKTLVKLTRMLAITSVYFNKYITIFCWIKKYWLMLKKLDNFVNELKRKWLKTVFQCKSTAVLANIIDRCKNSQLYLNILIFPY